MVARTKSCKVMKLIIYVCPTHPCDARVLSQAQLCALWQASEDQKRKVAQLEKAVELERRTMAVDKALDVQVRACFT